MSKEQDNDISENSTPSISSGFRLQFEEAQDAWVLLYPEGMVKLNPTAAEILNRCDGKQSVMDIVADLEKTFNEKDLSTDVMQFMAIAGEQKWIKLT